MADNSLLSQVGFTGQTQGPFTNLLSSGLMPGSQPLPQPSGFMGKGGKIAYFADALLNGMQKGRMLSYMAQETQKQQQFKGALALIQSRLDQPGLSQGQISALQRMQGDVYAQYYNAISGDQDQNQGKKKKKSGNNQTDSSGSGAASGSNATAGPIGAVKNAIGSIFQTLGGKANLPQSGAVDINQLRGQMEALGVPDLNGRIQRYQSELNGIRKGMNPKDADQLWANEDFQKVYAKMQSEFPNKPEEAAKYLQPVMAGLYSRPEQQQIDIRQQELGGREEVDKQLNSAEPPERPGESMGITVTPGVAIPGGGIIPSIPVLPKETVPGNPLSAYYKSGPPIQMSSRGWQQLSQMYPTFKIGEPLYLTSPDGSKTMEVKQMLPDMSHRGAAFTDPFNSGKEVNVQAMLSQGWTQSRKDPSATREPITWEADPKDPTKLIGLVDRGGKMVPMDDPLNPGHPMMKTAPEHQTKVNAELEKNNERYADDARRAEDWKESEILSRKAQIVNSATLITPEDKANAIKDMQKDVEDGYQRKLSAYKELRQQEEDRINGDNGKPLSPKARLTIAEENNNPGNIRDTVTGEFKHYDTVEDGWKDLEYQAKYKLDGRDSRVLVAAKAAGRSTPSIMDLATVYAPPSENNTKKWANDVAQFLGGKDGKITAETPLDQFKNDPKRFAQAISYAEGTLGKIPMASPAAPPTSTPQGSIMGGSGKNVTVTWGEIIK